MNGVRLLETEEKQQLFTILNALPEWFGIPESLVEYVENSYSLKVLGYVEEERVLGFLTMKPTSEETMEVYVMGVLPDYHRQGIASALMKECKTFAKARHFQYLQVKTLSPEVQDAGYLNTYAFYRSMGFCDVEVLPLWDAHNPCLMMIQKL